jgi:phosphohistidine phosphatase
MGQTQKRLFLFRHAKSSWDDPGLADHDRPLAPRGRRAAKSMVKHLRREGVAPEIVLCSSARRAQETLEGIAPALGDNVTVLIEPELYGASASGLLERLRRLPEDTGSAMLVGHNPAMQELALNLAGAGSGRAAIEGKYPTAALATLSFEGSWTELGVGAAELVDFVTPKALKRSGQE